MLAIFVAPARFDAFAANSASAPANTWALSATLPETFDSPIFAIAVSPDNGHTVLVGTPTGNIYRSSDAGATWAPVAHGLGRGVLAIAFDPLQTTTVLAGTRAGGLWTSSNAGVSWAQQRVGPTATVRAFGFTRLASFAATDNGILIQRAGGSWVGGGLGGVSLDSLAVAAVNDPGKIVAGGDASQQGGLPLYESEDGGATWNPLRNPSQSNSMVSALAAGPLLNGKDVRPVVMGTNSGAFVSTDNGQTWTALGLPPTDVTNVTFVNGDANRFYVASDGGGSDRGGLWFTSDEGATFHDLKPPLPEVTGLAAGTGDQPQLYVATFRPIDHAVMLWGYHDTGGAPRAPAAGVPAPAKGVAAQPASARDAQGGLLRDTLSVSELPYVAAGVLSIFVLFLALVAYVGRGRPRRA